MVPTTNGNPSRYQPNPIDDRRLYRSLPPQVRRNIRSAESALRRAAFAIVAYAPDPKEG